MGERYPDRIPPALAEVLGLPPYELHPWWMALREVGVEVPKRYEGEVASALHFLIPFALSSPDDWRGAAIEELQRLKAGGTFVPAAFQLTPVPMPDEHAPGIDLVGMLEAAGSLLRSFHYGNSATEAARDMADTCDHVVQRARSPNGRSAHAEVVDGKVRVHILGTVDPGPMKVFEPLLYVDLDEMHALELLGTLTIAHRHLVDARVDGGE